MRVRRTLFLAWYLFKNHTLNPVLKRMGRVYPLVFIIYVCLIATPLALTFLNLGKTQDVTWVRKLLIAHGLNRYLLINILSSLLTGMTLLSLIIGKSVIVVMEDAESEVLLAQPIELKEYILGRGLYEVASAASYTLAFPLSYSFPLIYGLSGNDVFKGFLFLISSLIAFSSLILLINLTAVIRVLLIS